ncbi:hypothetical protein QO004_003689 [Rhizobium mesoamericanum]|nr:hypothetical protein [Rhizobium mesoamericanum]MDQ0561888.1 hypothetical protein [Rhizobium mesoamericanum]
MVSIQQGFAKGPYDIVTGDVERLAGRPPKRLRDVIGAMFSSSAA